ncbi:MAG: hypothetical protein QW176_05230 [Candidatus Bathyarchaeia archaeon]
MERNRAIELVYEEKEDERSILARTKPAFLHEAKRFGISLDGSYNMLIFGDNLPVLRALMDEPSIKGKVRLIYIDPPFSTNHEFRAGASRTATVSASRNDKIAYEDTLVGAEYLEFLRRRLILLRELLADERVNLCAHRLEDGTLR